MIKIAVVDDSKEILETVCTKVEKLGRAEEVQIVAAPFSAAKYLIYELEDGIRYHIYLLDIEMPVINGVQLAEKIREYDRSAYIIFITSHLSYAVLGYELSIYRYIPKDNIEDKLPDALRSILKELAIQNDKTYIIKTNNRVEIIAYRDIYYLYKEGKNSVFVTIHGKSSIRKTLEQIYEKLDHKDFIYVDRGYIVNLFHIMKFEHGELLMRNQELLPVSRGNKQKVKMEIFDFWRYEE